jgi:hypothetical protein
MQLRPEPMGIVKRKGTEHASMSCSRLPIFQRPNPNSNPDPTQTPKGGLHSVDLQSYSMGDNHSIALATGLQNSRSIESLNLSDNRLSTKGLRAILKAIHPEQREEHKKTQDKVILSYPILSYPILSYLILSYPI